MVVISLHTSEVQLHPITFHSHTFTGSELNYDVHNKELLEMFKAFKCWWHYLESFTSPIYVVTDHQDLEYFCTTQLLTQTQACWSEYLFQFNLIIRFHPSKLRANPNALTRQWDVHLKEGGCQGMTSWYIYFLLFSFPVYSPLPMSPPSCLISHSISPSLLLVCLYLSLWTGSS